MLPNARIRLVYRALKQDYKTVIVLPGVPRKGERVSFNLGFAGGPDQDVCLIADLVEWTPGGSEDAIVYCYKVSGLDYRKP